VSWQLSTARTEVLDDGRQRRYCRIIVAGCCSQPLRIARCGARSDRRSQATVRSHFSNRFLVVCSCDVTSAKPINRIGLRFGHRPGADPNVHHTSNHHAATAVRLSEVDASGHALSAPIQREQQRHRRSEWAGVSWPKEDDHERGAADSTGSALVRRKADRAATTQIRRFVGSFVPWRGRPHASASSWN
jgi:hypothetical protein